jgi:hypothetical protein
MLRYYICVLAHFGLLYDEGARLGGQIILWGSITAKFYGGMFVDDASQRFRIGRTAVPETGTAGQSLTCLP